MARRRKPIYLRLLQGLLPAIFLLVIGGPAIKRSFAIMQGAITLNFQAAKAKMSAAQAHQEAQPHTIQQSQTMSPYEAQRAAEIEAQRTADLQRQIEQQRLKDAAWERFYIPPEACKHPESPTRFDVCSSREVRFRKDFERRWAAGEFSQSSS